MASKSWIKIYHKLLNDRSIASLPNNLWRRYMELNILAGELSTELPDNDRGGLPCLDDIAWNLRVDPAQLSIELAELTEKGFLVVTETGYLLPNFAAEQAAIDNTERTRLHRERKAAPPKTVMPVTVMPAVTIVEEVSNESETNRYIELEEDIDKEFKEEEEPAARHSDFAKVCQSYQMEIGGLSQTISDMINDDLAVSPADWIIQAMQRAAEQNKRSYAYVRGILKNWTANGGPQNDKPKNKGANNGHSSKHYSQNGKTGFDLDNEPTYDPYTGRTIPAGA